MKTFPSILLLACASLGLLSCTRSFPEETVAPPDAEEILYVTAGFEDGDGEAPGTRTALSLNEAGTNASVLWTRGDRFQVMVRTGSNTWRSYNYTTNDTGPVATFSGSAPSGGGPYFCVYPTSRAHGVVGLDGVSDPVLIASIPSQQTAVAGGIESGLNVSVAYTTDMSAHLSFRNVLSYIRFRLSGAATASVVSVKLDTDRTIAGDATIYGTPSGGADARFDINWSSTFETRSSEITLTGPFETGQDYFIALTPVSLNGFSLVFEDADGHRIRKHSTLVLPLERSRIYDFGTIEIGDSFPTEETGEFVSQYMTATSGSKPVDLCVISEGFVKSELDTYKTQAERAIDFLFDTEPYKSYKEYFNVYILGVPSEESGASVTDGNGTVTTSRDTYFKARWGASSYTDMVANETSVYNYVSRHCPDIVAGTHAIDDVSILMLINDSRYGGICHVYSTGSNYSMVPLINGGDRIYWKYPDITPNTDDPIPTPDDPSIMNDYYRRTTEAERSEMGQSSGDWRNTVVHEFGGHGFGRLKDEYWPSNSLSYVSGSVEGHNWPVPFGLNLAANPASTPWASDLLSRLDELTDRDGRYGRIGAFQGGENTIFGRWRSEKISCMIDNRPYFSAWQRVLIVKRIKQLAGETFTFSDFLSKDVTLDPVRDRSRGAAEGRMKAGDEPVVYSPPFAAPVLHEVPLRELP